MSRIVPNVNDPLWIFARNARVLFLHMFVLFHRATPFRPAKGTERGAAPVQSVLVGSRLFQFLFFCDNGVEKETRQKKKRVEQYLQSFKVGGGGEQPDTKHKPVLLFVCFKESNLPVACMCLL